MPLDVFANIGSGSNPETLLGPRAFGNWNGGEYAIFNMDSGHMLVSMTLQKRSYAELKQFASQLAGKTYTGQEDSGQVMNWLFKTKTVKQVFDAMTSTEKFAYNLEVQALRSSLHLGPLTYHKPVEDPTERQAWAAYELRRPNFEIALADEVLLPEHRCYAVISLSPYGYYPINRSTVDLLKPGGFFVVAGNFKKNAYCSEPAGKKVNPCTEFGLTDVSQTESKNLPWFKTLRETQRSVHTHSTESFDIDFLLFQLPE